MHRIRNRWIFAALWLVIAVPVRAQNDILKAIPADALGFVVINNLEGTDAKWEKTVQTVIGASIPLNLSTLKISTGIQDGLLDKGSAAIVVMPSPGGIPTEGVVLLPTSDFKALIAGLKPENPDEQVVNVTVSGQLLWAAKKGGYTALAQRNSASLKQVLAAAADVSGACRETAPWLGTQNAALVLTNAGVKMLAAGATKGLADARRSMVQFPDPQMQESIRGTFELFDMLLAGTQREVNQFSVGVRIDDGGSVHLGTFTSFNAGGAVHGALASVKLNTGNLLDGLPAGPYFVAAGGILPEKWPTGLEEFTARFAKANPAFANMKEEEIRSLLKDSYASMHGVQSMSFVMAPPKQGEAIYAGLSGVMRMADAKTFLAGYTKALDRMQAIYAKIPNGTISMEQKPFKSGELEGLELIFDFSGQMKTLPPQAQPLFKMLFGPENKLSTYVVAADPKTTILAYVSPDHLARIATSLKTPSAGLVSDAPLGQSAQLLPAGSQFVIYVSPQGTIDLAKTMIATLVAIGQPLPTLPDFPSTPPLAAGLKFAPAGVETDLVVPAVTLETIAKYGRELPGKLK